MHTQPRARRAPVPARAGTGTGGTPLPGVRDPSAALQHPARALQQAFACAGSSATWGGGCTGIEGAGMGGCPERGGGDL